MSRIPSREESLFAEVLAQPPAARGVFLAQACGADAALLARIAALIAAHEGSNSLLQPPTAAAHDSVSPEEKPGDWIGRYKLLQQIGEGGCGVVWMAEQEEPVRRRVALKVIKLGMNTKAVVARFEAERQALAIMDHPNIAKVLDGGATDTGRPFFVMELVRGIPFTRFCDDENLATSERLELFILVCQAVQHAHQKGIIHRDLKPSNVLVTIIDGAPVPKVIDFGIAKATQGRLTDATLFTAFEQFIGTPAYMSPEQAELSGCDIDTRSDIYSLGVMLYEVLTGKPPFDPATLLKAGLDEVRRIIREVEPARPSTRLSTLDADDRLTVARHRRVDAQQLSTLLRSDLDWVVMKALEKNRSRRYATANGLAMDIRRYLNDEPVVARPPSTGYLLQKLLKRHRLAVATAAVILITLLLGSAVSTWAFWKEKAARIRAVAAEQEQMRERQQADAARQRAVAAEAEQSRLRQQAEAARSNEAEQRIGAEEARNNARRLLYAADMNLADQALKANNLGRVHRLLDRHRPASATEKDMRGWEWRYLWQQARSDAEPLVDRDPMDPATDETRTWTVSYSPGGKYLAVGYRDGRVEVWDTAQKLVRVMEPGTSRTTNPAVVAFSPTVNGLAMTGSRGVVHWFDLLTGERRVLCDVKAFVRDMEFSQDGSRLVITTHFPGRVHLVDPTKGILTTRETPNATGVHFDRARLSSDRDRLYYMQKVGERSSLRCLQLSGEKVLWEIDSGRELGFTAIALSPDDRLLATGTGYEDGTIRIWDALTGQAVGAAVGHRRWVSNLTFSADGRTLASASADQTVRLWDTSSWKEKRLLRGHRDEVHAMALSPNGEFVASGAKDGSVYLWSATSPRASGSRTTLPEHIQAAWPLAGGPAVIAYSAQQRWLLINLRTLEESSLPFPANERLYFVPPNVMGVYDGSDRLRLFELFANGNRLIAELAVGPTFSGSFAYSPHGPLVAWGNGTRALHMVRLDSTFARKELTSKVDRVEPVNFSSDGKMLHGRGQVSGSAMWNVETGNAASTLATTAPSPAARLPYGPPNSLSTQRALNVYRPPGGVTSSALSNDGRTLAIAAQSGVVAVYEYAKPKNHTILRGHMQGVHGVTFSPDGKRLVTTGGGDECAKLWDAATWQELITLAGTGSLITFAAFSTDENTLMIGSRAQAGRYQFWTVPSWEEIAMAEQAGKDATPTWRTAPPSTVRYADAPQNLSFEATSGEDWPNGWFRIGTKAYSYAIGVDRDQAGKTPVSVRMKSTESAIDGFEGMGQYVMADNYRGKRVRFSAWLKTESALRAHLYLGVYRDGRSVAFDNMARRAVTGTTDWTQCSVVLDVEAEATHVNFGLFVQGKGTAWFNHPQFEIVGTDVPTTDNRVALPSPASPAPTR